MQPFWSQVESAKLAQGDLLKECFVPVFEPAFTSAETVNEVPVALADLIIMTQSCDLENNKAELVSCCAIFSLTEFAEANPKFKKKDHLEAVRKGRVEGLHLLASPVDPRDNQAALVVDFKKIVSLPFSYLTQRAVELGPRWRLDSPFLEHYSQAFARFFMRVGLPSAIPPYK